VVYNLCSLECHSRTHPPTYCTPSLCLLTDLLHSLIHPLLHSLATITYIYTLHSFTVSHHFAYSLIYFTLSPIHHFTHLPESLTHHWPSWLSHSPITSFTCLHHLHTYTSLIHCFPPLHTPITLLTHWPTSLSHQLACITYSYTYTPLIHCFLPLHAPATLLTHWPTSLCHPPITSLTSFAHIHALY
jgi:hypothetical protein